MIDSGAYTNFTALQKGNKNWKPITLQEYAAACKTYYRDTWQYVTLDVIMKPKETLDNLNAMYEVGLKPMPVLTLNSPIDEMREYIKLNRRICLSGGAISSNDKLIGRRIIDAFNATEGKAQIHALGFMRFPDVYNLPIATMDASSMNGGARYGNLIVFDKKRGLMSAHWSEVAKPKNEKNKHILGILLRSGIGVDLLTDKSNYATSMGIPSLLTLFAYLQYANESTKHGVGLFFSLSSLLWLQMTVSVIGATDGHRFDFILARKILMELRTLVKEGQNDRMHSIMHEILRTKTDYNTNILSDNQVVTRLT
jgi:hypothetical protein